MPEDTQMAALLDEVTTETPIETPPEEASKETPTEEPKETPKEPAKKEEPKDDTLGTLLGDGKKEEKTEDEPPADLSPKGKEAWESFKTKTHAAITEKDARIAELEAKLSETPPDIKEELDRLKNENTEYEKTVSVAELSRHPKFRAEYDDKIAQLGEDIGSLAKELDADPAAILAASKLTGRAKYDALEEALEDVPELARADILAKANQVSALDRERTAKLEAAREELRNVHKQEQDAAQKEQARRITEIESTLDRLAKEPDAKLLQRIPGNDAHNSFVDKSWQEVNRLLVADDVTAEDFAKVLAKGTAYDLAEEQLIKVRAELDKAQKSIAEYESGRPSVGGSAGSSGASDPLQAILDEVMG